MTNSQKNEKALAILENLKMRFMAGRVESDLEIEDTLVEAIATLCEPETVGEEVLTVSREVADMVNDFRSNHFDMVRGEYRWTWLEGAIHALIQSRVGGSK